MLLNCSPWKIRHDRHKKSDLAFGAVVADTNFSWIGLRAYISLYLPTILSFNCFAYRSVENLTFHWESSSYTNNIVQSLSLQKLNFPFYYSPNQYKQFFIQSHASELLTCRLTLNPLPKHKILLLHTMRHHIRMKNCLLHATSSKHPQERHIAPHKFASNQ